MTQLLQNAAYGTALILAVAILRRVLRDRLVLEARLALWAVCLFRLLTPAAPESVLSLWGLSRLFAPEEPAPLPVPVTGYVLAGDMPAPAPQPGPGLSWETALLALWLAVGAALAVHYALSWRRTRRAVTCAIPLDRDDPRYVPLPKCARLREGPMEGAPLTFGVVRPTVVLSPGLDGGALDCVLAHEGVHARRRDNLWHYAGALALAVHWWNPAVWLMIRLLRRDIELSCDRAALNRLGPDRRAEYANTLVSLATQTEGPAFCQTFGRKATEERILSIMKFKKISLAGAAFSLALVLAVTTAFASEPKELKFETKGSQDGIVWMPDIEKTKDIMVNDPVDPDDVDLSMIEEKYAQKVADGEMTQEEADEAMGAFRDMLDRARRGEVKLFLTDDGWVNGMGVSKMYHRDEDGELIPMGPVNTEGGSVAVGKIGSRFYSYQVSDGSSDVSGGAVRTSSGTYQLCRDKDCDVSYDHCHIDGKVVRVYYEYPGLLCAHPDCDNDKPHEHDGTKYVGKAPENYVIFDREMDDIIVESGAPVPVNSSPLITEQGEPGESAPMRRVTLEEYKALLDGLVSQGKMSREDADWFLDGATKGMKHPANRLYVTEDGSYAIM